MDYNVKCLHFVNGETETRLYSHPISLGGEKSKNKQKLKNKNLVQNLDDKEKERIMKISLNRTINNIYNISKSNRWQWFVTLTLDGKQVDRYDYKACAPKVTQWLNNIKRDHPDLRYVLVPELHKDGAYHFHGLFADATLPMLFSGKFTKGGDPIYNIMGYKLGWTTATEVDNNDAVAKYITKYITKDLINQTKGRKRYWVSQNVDRPVEQLFLLDGSDRHVLQCELDADNDRAKHVVVEVAGSVRTVDYYVNQGLVLSAPEVNI